MSPEAKIILAAEARGVRDIVLAEGAATPKSTITGLRKSYNGKEDRQVLFRTVARMAKFLKVPLDWLADPDNLDVPEPDGSSGSSAVFLSADQKRLLEIAETLGEELAIRRLLLIDGEGGSGAGGPKRFGPPPKNSPGSGQRGRRSG